MKLSTLGLIVAGLIAVAPTASAQNAGSWGNASTPGAGAGVKDDQTITTKKSKRHVSHTRSRPSMISRSRIGTTGYGGSSTAPGAGAGYKDDVDLAKVPRR